MKLTKIQLKKIKAEAKKIYQKNKDSFHHFDHAQLTSNLAVYLAKKEKANIEVCRVAGLIHDLAPKKRGHAHGEQSAKIASQLMKKIGLDKDFINQVCLAIMYHDKSKSHLIRTLEGKIIFEADKLQAIGPIGCLREYGDLLIKGYKSKKAIEKFLSYLKDYNPRFLTKTGKIKGKKLKKFDANFLKFYIEYQKL